MNHPTRRDAAPPSLVIRTRSGVGQAALGPTLRRSPSGPCADWMIRFQVSGSVGGGSPVGIGCNPAAAIRGGLGVRVRRVLIVANRTVATPMLFGEVRRRATRQRCEFALVVPYAGRRDDDYWTLESAQALLEEASGARVQALGQGSEALRAAGRRVRRGDFDEVIVSTWPRRPMRGPLDRDAARR